MSAPMKPARSQAMMAELLAVHLASLKPFETSFRLQYPPYAAVREIADRHLREAVHEVSQLIRPADQAEAERALRQADEAAAFDDDLEGP